MYFVVIFSILIAVSAGKNLPKSGVPAYPKKAGPTAPEPCCAPEQYTYHIGVSIVQLDLGELLTIFGKGRGAYDAVNQILGEEAVVDVSNGTEDIRQRILDFKKLKGYDITKVKGNVQCKKFAIPEGTFRENCIPDNAKFTGSATVGDRALKSDQWYVTRNDSSAHETFHTVYSIKAEGCVDLGSVRRIFDSDTGAEIRLETANWYNFNLGIDDPDRWFKPPSECEGAKVTAIPAGLRHSPMYGGKVTLFK